MYGNGSWPVTYGGIRRSVGYNNAGSANGIYADDANRGQSNSSMFPPSGDGRSDSTGMFSCVCCGTLLRLPPNSPCFRCTICDTVNDLFPHPPLVNFTTPCGVYQVEYYVAQYFRGLMSIDAFIDVVIRPVFSSAASLNLSYKDGINFKPCYPELEQQSQTNMQEHVEETFQLDSNQTAGGALQDSAPSAPKIELPPQFSDLDPLVYPEHASSSADLMQFNDTVPTQQPVQIVQPVHIVQPVQTLQESPKPQPEIVELPLLRNSIGIVFNLIDKVAEHSPENETKIASALIECSLQALKRPGFMFKEPRDILFLQYLLDLPLPHESKLRSPELVVKLRSLLSRLYGFLGCVSPQLQNYLVHCFSQQLSKSSLQKKLDQSHRYLSFLLTSAASSDVISVQSYSQQWEVRCTARFMALIYAGNQMRPSHTFVEISQSRIVNPELEKLAICSFYNTVADYVDIAADFHSWSSSPVVFSFCQYPFLMSLGSKLRILEQETQMAMNMKERAAVLQTLFQGQFSDPVLSISVRRSHLIGDSVRALSQPNLDFGKKLRVTFIDEDGVDAGGLTKEWFLLLTRQLFDASYAIFDVDDDSQLCWFSKQFIEGDTEFISNFYLLGLIVALAIYNSNNLDLNLPLAAYKMLCGLRPSVEDYTVLHPLKGRQFVQMLEFSGTAAEFDAIYFGIDFVAEYDCFGEKMRHSLIPNGENVSVSLENRQEYVDRYIEWYFCVSSKVQYDSFKQGFQRVLTGKAVPLFCPEELELLVRGSPELDLGGLEAIATFENCSKSDMLIVWLFEIISGFSQDEKRKFLSFVTGTDRLPATGLENMTFKVSVITESSSKARRHAQFAVSEQPRSSSLIAPAQASRAEDNISDTNLSEYLPVAHTCFNQLCLYNYSSKEQLYDKLSKAISYSSEFGLR